MKPSVMFAAALFVVLAGCNGDTPASPSTTSPVATGVVWGHVADSASTCLTGATVVMLDGPRPGSSYRSTCIGSDDPQQSGYFFANLPPNVAIHLRASKEGFVTRDIVVQAVVGEWTQFDFVLVSQ